MLTRGLVSCLCVATLSLAGAAVMPAAAADTGGLSHVIPCGAGSASYPGSRPTDCVAVGNGSVYVDHTIVNVRWAVTPDMFGLINLCAAVSIRNLNRSSYFYNDFNMTMRYPDRKVMVMNFGAQHALNDGFIAPGGVARGNICFDYFHQAGEYVAMYSPHVLSPIRGIWLVHIS